MSYVTNFTDVYFTEIHETFVRRRGKQLFLSSLDAVLIEVWHERGIPLHVVIRSIESVFDVFDKQPRGTRTIKGLAFCTDEIEAQFAEWVRSQAGKSAASDIETESAYSPEAISAHISSAVESLSANQTSGLGEEIARAVARLEELNANLPGDAETVDATLGDIEKSLDRAMLTNWESVHLKALEKDVAGQLKQYKADMDAAAYKNTFDLMLLKRLREEAGVPRLGLFYL